MNYWRAKAAHLECLVRHVEADAIRDRVFREEGLDPTQQYHLIDQTETAALISAQSSQPAPIVAPQE